MEIFASFPIFIKGIKEKLNDLESESYFKMREKLANLN